MQLPQQTTTLGVPHSVPLHPVHGSRPWPCALSLFAITVSAQVVWNWQAVAVVRSAPARFQENQPACPVGNPVAVAFTSGS